MVFTAALEKIPRSFYERDATTVAKDLLGRYLLHVTGDIARIGKIVEVEAYLGQQDLAAHASKGLTSRTAVLFGPPGHAYVYRIYGLHWCMNVVSEPVGKGGSVLLRAIQPVQNVLGPTQGPGLLCKALEIDKRLNGHDLLSDDFFLATALEPEAFTIVNRPRIGVDYAGEWAYQPLRFYIEGNPFISRS